MTPVQHRAACLKRRMSYSRVVAVMGRSLGVMCAILALFGGSAEAQTARFVGKYLKFADSAKAKPRRVLVFDYQPEPVSTTIHAIQTRRGVTLVLFTYVGRWMPSSARPEHGEFASDLWQILAHVTIKRGEVTSQEVSSFG